MRSPGERREVSNVVLTANDRTLVLYAAWRSAVTARDLSQMAELPESVAAEVSALLEDAAAALHRNYAKGLTSGC